MITKRKPPGGGDGGTLRARRRARPRMYFSFVLSFVLFLRYSSLSFVQVDRRRGGPTRIGDACLGWDKDIYKSPPLLLRSGRAAAMAL